MSKYLKCGDCAKYKTDACEYTNYAEETDNLCPCYVVDVDEVYEKGRADALDHCEKCEEDQWDALYKAEMKGRADALDEQLQEFAQWLWDSHYLVDEAFTIRLVEQYKLEKKKDNIDEVE